MRFGIERVWGDVYEVKEFDTLEDLIEWCKGIENEIIINVRPSTYQSDKIQAGRDYDYSLEIYDDYRE